MLPKEFVDALKNAGQILLLLLLLAYLIFCAAISIVLLVRSCWRIEKTLRGFFSKKINDDSSPKPNQAVERILGDEKRYAMASRNMC
jgi:hypothetical protein